MTGLIKNASSVPGRRDLEVIQRVKLDGVAQLRVRSVHAITTSSRQYEMELSGQPLTPMSSFDQNKLELPANVPRMPSKETCGLMIKNRLPAGLFGVMVVVDRGRDRIRINALCPAGVRITTPRATVGKDVGGRIFRPALSRNHAGDRAVCSGGSLPLSIESFRLGGGRECGYTVPVARGAGRSTFLNQTTH